MHILIANDDGINAPGIYALAEEISKYHEITIVAPDEQRSASSHSITISRPLRVRKHKYENIKAEAYSIDGTPADCVRLALDKLVHKKVDLVLSGINKGYNLGMDVLYSGTVSAAVEAAIYNIPSIAVSTDQFNEVKQYKVAAHYARVVLDKALEKKVKSDIVLNLNVPALSVEEIKGIRVCRMGNMVYGNYFVEREVKEAKDEFSDIIYDIKGTVFEPAAEDMDTYFIKKGYATVTPLHYDLTNFKIIGEVSQWF